MHGRLVRDLLAAEYTQIHSFKTAKGKSFLFLLFIWTGYVFGVCSKLVSGNITYVFIFYVLNLVMVSIDVVLYFINRMRDRNRQASEEDHKTVS